MRNKITVGIIFGGKSAEHEVSVQSALNIYQAIDKDKYNVVLIGLDKQGGWNFELPINSLMVGNITKLNNREKSQTISPKKIGETSKVATLPAQKEVTNIDIFFPVLHGPYGEDGTIQGLLKILGKPFVGSSVLGSAIGMDKDIMKRLLEHADIPVVKYIAIKRKYSGDLSYASVSKEFGDIFFIKPANLGSSVGVHKVKNKEDFAYALNDAFQYDNKILVEEFVCAREIECSVLGNDEPVASLPGEVIPLHEFYSYESKYIDENGASIEIPARISEDKVREVQELAIKVFRTLSCEGLARVDFFMDKETEKLYVNEINTMPGFTNISMYPKLWEASGISYPDLISKLIDLALERYSLESSLKTSL